MSGNEAGSMKRPTGRMVGGHDIRLREAAPYHMGKTQNSTKVGSEDHNDQYLPTLVRLDFLNPELSVEERAELRLKALESCVGVSVEVEVEQITNTGSTEDTESEVPHVTRAE